MAIRKRIDPFSPDTFKKGSWEMYFKDWALCELSAKKMVDKRLENKRI
jgi:hypothetical protein